MTKARDKLLHQSKKDPNWIIHDRVAIGDRNDFVDINISKNYKTVCVDNNNNLHDKVKQVPAIIDDTLSDILVGDEAVKYIKNLQFFSTGPWISMPSFLLDLLKV